MADRTFGWVQDSQDITKLFDVVSLFEPNSILHQRVLTQSVSSLVKSVLDQTRLINALNSRPLRLTYGELRGQRKEYKGLVQLAVAGQLQAATGQAPPPLTEWASDNFVRWAHAMGFIQYDRASDTFEITPLGSRYIASPTAGGINDVLREAMLSYPPAVRLLRLLKTQGHSTKFEIGRQLGFVGETGFTNYPQDALLYELAQPGALRGKLFADCEGSADKYARGIASWLIKLGWVVEQPKTVQANFAGKTYQDTIGKAYVITPTGEKALKTAEGYSRYAPTPKNVFFEMLAGGTEGDKRYLRTRRGLILEILQKGPRTAAQVVSELTAAGLRAAGGSPVDEPTVIDDIAGLQNIGLQIVLPAPTSGYDLKDKIQYLDVPKTAPPQSTKIQNLKNAVRIRLVKVDHAFLDLIDLSFDGAQDRLFEARTMKLLNDCGFLGGHRGGSNRPDGLLFTQGGAKDYGLIVDTKAYGKGFSCPAGSRDEMARYIQENIGRPAPHPTTWWTEFPTLLIAPDAFRFLFVSGEFVGSYLSQFDRIRLLTNNTLGAGITADNLLRWAEEIMNGRLSLDDGYTRFSGLNNVVIP